MNPLGVKARGLYGGRATIQVVHKPPARHKPFGSQIIMAADAIKQTHLSLDFLQRRFHAGNDVLAPI